MGKATLSEPGQTDLVGTGDPCPQGIRPSPPPPISLLSVCTHLFGLKSYSVVGRIPHGPRDSWPGTHKASVIQSNTNPGTAGQRICR